MHVLYDQEDKSSSRRVLCNNSSLPEPLGSGLRSRGSRVRTGAFAVTPVLGDSDTNFSFFEP